MNPADAPILTLAPRPRRCRCPQVEDLADTRLAQKIAEVSGVGLVSVSGGQRPAVRIRANPTALAAYGLTLEDVRTAVAATNVNRAKGGFDGPGALLHDRRERPARLERGLSSRRSSRTGTARRSGSPTSPTSPTTPRT